jgi:hypothetical protein
MNIRGEKFVKVNPGEQWIPRITVYPAVSLNSRKSGKGALFLNLVCRRGRIHRAQESLEFFPDQFVSSSSIYFRGG